MIISNDILDKLKTYIGFSIKSGKVIYGSDNIIKQSLKRRIEVLIIDNTVANNTKKKVDKVRIKNGIELFSVENWEELKINEGIKVIAIQKCELADVIKKLLIKNE